MNEQILFDQLLKFGLSEVEIQIYLFLLKNGPKTPLELSRETNIDRSKIYRNIDLLKEKKLIELFASDRGVKLKSASPVNLELLLIHSEEKIKSNREQLSGILTQLSTLPNASREQFEVFHYKGEDGLKQMLWNELKAKEILVFGFETTNDFVGKKFADKFREEAISRNIKFREIGNLIKHMSKSQSHYNSATGWEKYYSFRYISEKLLPIKAGMQVFNNTVSIINWKDGMVGLEIVNKPFADMQRLVFEQYWKLCKK